MHQRKISSEIIKPNRGQARCLENHLVTSNVEFKCGGGAIVAFVVKSGDTSSGVGCRVNANSIQSPIPRALASDKKTSRLPRTRTNEIPITTSNSARARRGCHSAKSLANLGLLMKPIARFVGMKQAKKAKGRRNCGKSTG